MFNMARGLGGGPGGFGRMRFDEETAEKPKINKSMLIRIMKYFKPFWKQMILAVVAIFISSLLGLVPPVIIKNIVDIALPQKDLHLLITLIVISIGTTILLQLLQVGQSFLNTWIAKHIIFNMKNHMYQYLQHMSLNFFSSTKPGEITTRITSDIDGIQDVFNSTIINVLNSIFVLITTAALLISMSWKLAIVGMAILPVFILPTRKVGSFRWKVAMESQQTISDLNQLIQETLSISGFILMKIFTREKEEFRKFEDTNKKVIKLQIRESLAGRWFFMTMSIFTTIGPMLVYLYGGYLFIRGEVTIGVIIAFIALLQRLYGPVVQLSNIHIDVTRSLALFQRVFEYFDKQQEIVDKPGASVMEPILGRLDFDNVHFSYSKGVEVLIDVSFTAAAGTMTALVGASGAGKTTVTNLIPRLYDVSKGRILIDGTDIRDVTQESLRSQIGIVMQEPYLFNDTIEANLRYGRQNALDEDLINACKAAYIHEFIMGLPDQYKSIVGNRGIKLSGGEKQRISIARVILKNPRIIILDEATSSLDSVSEMYIQKAMLPLLQGRTSFVIAHRLSTILAADQILVFEKGRIAEIGRHEELIKNDEIYRNLYDTQFKKKR
jgi:ATP-binding cassette subfamily B protein